MRAGAAANAGPHLQQILQSKPLSTSQHMQRKTTCPRTGSKRTSSCRHAYARLGGEGAIPPGASGSSVAPPPTPVLSCSQFDLFKRCAAAPARVPDMGEKCWRRSHPAVVSVCVRARMQVAWVRACACVCMHAWSVPALPWIITRRDWAHSTPPAPLHIPWSSPSTNIRQQTSVNKHPSTNIVSTRLPSVSLPADPPPAPMRLLLPAHAKQRDWTQHTHTHRTARERESEQDRMSTRAQESVRQLTRRRDDYDIITHTDITYYSDITLE